jgi:hypothetical protein
MSFHANLMRSGTSLMNIRTRPMRIRTTQVSCGAGPMPWVAFTIASRMRTRRRNARIRRRHARASGNPKILQFPSPQGARAHLSCS